MSINDRHREHTPNGRFGHAWMTLALAGALIVAGCTWWVSAPEAVAAAGKQLSPRELTSIYLEARLAMAGGYPEQALERLEVARAAGNAGPEIYASIAEIHLEDIALERARETLDEGLKQHPEEPRLLMLLASLQEKSGKLDEAIATLERVLVKQPQRRSVLEQLSQLHLKRFRFIRTPEDLKKEVAALAEVYEAMLGTAQGTERLGPLLVLSSLYLRLEAPERALVRAREAVQLRPVDIRTQLALATVLRANKKDDEALDAVRQALMIDASNPEAARMLGELMAGDSARVAGFYGEFAEKFPNDRALQIKAAAALSDARKWAEAEALLRKITERWPEERKPRLDLAAAIQAQGRADEALAIVREEMIKAPEDAELQAQAETLLATLDPDARGRFYSAIADAHPDNVDVQNMVARWLVREQRWAEAETRLTHIVERWPDQAAARMARVRVWLALEKLDLARQEALALAADGSEMAAVTALSVAEAMKNKGEGDAAIKFLEGWRAKAPQNESVTVWLGWELLTRKRLGEALALLEPYRKEHPGSFPVVSLMVDAYVQQDDHAKARALLDELPDEVTSEKSAEIAMLKASLERRAGRPAEALALLDGLVATLPENAPLWVEKGLVHQQLGQNPEAEAAYLKAIELEPEDPEVNNTLGYFYAETGQKLDEALRLINKALGLSPDSGHIVDSLGWVYYQRGDYQKAVEALTRAVELMSQRPDPVIYEHLGDALAKLGNVAGARDAWTRALDLEPEKPDAIRAKIDRHHQAGR